MATKKPEAFATGFFLIGEDGRIRYRGAVTAYGGPLGLDVSLII